MGKALVIPNVDFAANALTTVTLGQAVPCTGITLSDSTLSLTSLEPATLTATLTPANTTDALMWASSDNTVATVVNGIVTPLASGNVTITATCGSQSATCAVSISIRAYLDVHLTQLYSIQQTSSTGGNAARIDGGTSTNVATTINTTGTGKYAYDNNSLMPSGTHCYPVYLPQGCVGLSVTTPDQTIKISAHWCSSTAENGVGQNYITSVSYTNPWSSSIPAGNHTITVPDDDSIDCFYINVYLNGLTQDMVAGITVEALFE